MEATTTSPRPSQRRCAPLLKRSGTSVRGSSLTSPRTPCGPRTTPTTTWFASSGARAVEPSAGSVALEVDLGPIPRRHDPEERAYRLRAPAAAADDPPGVGDRHHAPSARCLARAGADRAVGRCVRLAYTRQADGHGQALGILLMGVMMSVMSVRCAGADRLMIGRSGFTRKIAVPPHTDARSG